MTIVDVGLLDPLPHRLHPVAQLGRNPLHRPVLGPKLCSQCADHADRRSLLLRGVAPRLRLPGHLLLRHGLILVSKVTSLQRTQCGSHRLDHRRPRDPQPCCDLRLRNALAGKPTDQRPVLQSDHSPIVVSVHLSSVGTVQPWSVADINLPRAAGTASRRVWLITDGCFTRLSPLRAGSGCNARDRFLTVVEEQRRHAEEGDRRPSCQAGMSKRLAY